MIITFTIWSQTSLTLGAKYHEPKSRNLLKVKHIYIDHYWLHVKMCVQTFSYFHSKVNILVLQTCHISWMNNSTDMFVILILYWRNVFNNYICVVLQFRYPSFYSFVWDKSLPEHWQKFARTLPIDWQKNARSSQEHCHSMYAKISSKHLNYANEFGARLRQPCSKHHLHGKSLRQPLLPSLLKGVCC